MSERFFLPRAVSPAHRTSGQRGGLVRETRDGHLVTRGPIIESSPDVVMLARLRLAAILLTTLGLSLGVDALVRSWP